MSEPIPGALAYDDLDATELEELTGLRAFVEREIGRGRGHGLIQRMIVARGPARRWKDECNGT